MSRMVEAAGVETSQSISSNLVMAHKFWSKWLNCHRFHHIFESGHVNCSRRDSTGVMETFWRREVKRS